MTIMFFDLETSSFPLMGVRSSDHAQPHIVESAAILTDDDGVELDRFEARVRPEGWVIPHEATRVHGITTEQALAEGVPEAQALAGLLALADRADERVAHNERFDARIIRIAIKRFWHPDPEERAELWREKPVPRCTLRMAQATRAFRWNTLNDVYRGLFFEDVHHAHKAMADVLACKRIFFELRNQERQRIADSGFEPPDGVGQNEFWV